MTRRIWSDPRTWTAGLLTAEDLTQETKENIGWLYERNRRVLHKQVTGGTASSTSEFTVAIVGLSLQQPASVRLKFHGQVYNTTGGAYNTFNLAYKPGSIDANIVYATSKTYNLFATRQQGASIRKQVSFEYIWSGFSAGYYLFFLVAEPIGGGTMHVAYDQVPYLYSIEEYGQ